MHLPRQTGHTEMHFLTPLEVARLAGTIEPRYHTLGFTAAFTGLRWGELAGLRRHRLDLDAGTVRVVQALSEVNGHVALGLTRTGAHRTVSLPPFLVEKLVEQLAAYASTDGFVFTSAEAHHCVAPSSAATSSLPLAAWPHARTPLPRPEAHVRRPADRPGRAPEEIQERMGHSTIRPAFDRYGHLFPSLDSRLREGLERAFRDADTPIRRAATPRPQ